MPSSQRGVTLIELVAVIVLLGILAAVGVPLYNNMMEDGRTTEAKTNLKIVYMAEKIRRLDQGAYWPDGVAKSTEDSPSSLPEINEALNIDIETPQYYQLGIIGAAGGASFCAEAPQIDGSKVFSISTDGEIKEVFCS